MPEPETPGPSPDTLHPCARCATMQKTCCQTAEILCTQGDLARIEEHTGRRDFWSLRTPQDPSYLECSPEDPNWIEYTTDAQNRRRTLLRQPNGDCVFLSDTGCVLPMEVRPLICRLYPFAYTERGLAGPGDHYCPKGVLLAEKPPGTTMLTVLHMTNADGERWQKMLYDELRRDKATAAAVLPDLDNDPDPSGRPGSSLPE